MADVQVHAVHGTGSIVGPAARLAAGWADRASLTQAGLARIGLFLAAAAAVWFTEGGLRGALLGSLLLGAVLFTDSTGAELERGRRVALGLWLGVLLSRLREYIVYAGLAVGGVLTGVPDAWAWAAGALIALAMCDSVAAARTTRSAGTYRISDRRAVPAQHHRDSPLNAMDPSRPPDGRVSSDPSLTAELLGEADEEPRDSGAPGNPIRIRTTPHSTRAPARWEEGRSRVMRGMGAAPDERAEPEGERGAYPTAERVSGPLVPGRVLRFPQAGRFAVIALTITIWDARVTFVALIIGCVVAICGEFADHPARDVAR